MNDKLNPQNSMQGLQESDYLSMTAGLEKIFIKKFKKSKKHLAVNDKKFTEIEVSLFSLKRNFDIFHIPYESAYALKSLPPKKKK